MRGKGGGRGRKEETKKKSDGLVRSRVGGGGDFCLETLFPD